MPISAPTVPSSAEPTADTIHDALHEARERTLALVAPLSDADVERVHSPLMSPLAWDLGHIAAFEDLWLVHRFGGEPLLRPDLARVYDAFESPRAGRGDLPFLRGAECVAYLAAVRERALAVLARLGPGDGRLHEMVVRHEHQHNETMLQTLQLARIEGYAPPGAQTPAAASAAPGDAGLETVEVPGGPCTIGAFAAGFAYDNERPRHGVDLPAFRIGRTPVTNEAYRAFVEDGGYARRDWWTEEGWAWKEEHGLRRPMGWTGDGQEWRLGRLEPLDPRKPVIHVSWFEADACARSFGARLPSEVEWEKAATWDGGAGTPREWPWGAEPPATERANLLDGRVYGPTAAGAHPDGAAPCGALGMIGDVWEWTASELDGYPGFLAHPYREYSEVFFRRGYRVLRGGSWATTARVASPTFRNWDLPQRRQIFAGFRIARDAGR